MHRNKIPQVFTLVSDCYVAPPLSLMVGKPEERRDEIKKA